MSNETPPVIGETPNNPLNSDEVTPETVKGWLEEMLTLGQKVERFNNVTLAAERVYKAYLAKCEELDDLERILQRKDFLTSKEKLYLIIQSQKAIIDKQRYALATIANNTGLLRANIATIAREALAPTTTKQEQ